MEEVILYDYWRSSAAYRVRIVLNMKGVEYRSISVDLSAGEQDSEAYRATNVQGRIPALSIDGMVLGQSLAIIDYLDAKFKEPRMVSKKPAERAITLQQSMIVAADIHPINNLSVLDYLKNEMGQDQAAIKRWYQHWIKQGFAALEAQAPDSGFFGGDTPNLADVCLIPQVTNARRFDTPLDTFPKLLRIDAAARELDAFARADPEAVRKA